MSATLMGMRLLLVRIAALVTVLVLPSELPARKFYNDDPLIQEPKPAPVQKVEPRKLSDLYDLFSHTFTDVGERQVPGKPVKAADVNTLGEVMDSAWYQQRHARKRMTLAELVASAGTSRVPSTTGKWTIISAKSEGITPGFLIQDDKGDRYFLKFDPVRNPEMTTAADVISSKFFYALGYHVPENYIVQVDRDRFDIKSDASFRDLKGRRRNLTQKDVSEIWLRTPRDAEGRSRATASRVIGGEILHPYRYYGTRKDDPNDTIPHEHRRSLRGLHVFCAWLGHDDSRAINTLDVLTAEGDTRYVKHYLLDFGSTLGSASTHANSPRSGFEQFFTWKSSAKEFFSVGLFVPSWSRIEYPKMPSVGRFTAEQFDPERWTPEYPNPAFRNRLPDDTFWAARQVAMFTDEEIRGIVKTGEYTDQAAEKYVADTLIQRRNAVQRAYLSAPLTLDNIRVEGGRVAFDDWASRSGGSSAVDYRYHWFVFDNERETRRPIASATSAAVPTDDSPYIGCEITAQSTNRKVIVYLRQAQPGREVVGIDRVWN